MTYFPLGHSWDRFKSPFSRITHGIDLRQTHHLLLIGAFCVDDVNGYKGMKTVAYMGPFYVKAWPGAWTRTHDLYYAHDL